MCSNIIRERRKSTSRHNNLNKDVRMVAWINQFRVGIAGVLWGVSHIINIYILRRDNTTSCHTITTWLSPTLPGFMSEKALSSMTRWRPSRVVLLPCGNANKICHLELDSETLCRNRCIHSYLHLAPFHYRSSNGGSCWY
jgi:hypothetical protein